MNLARGSDNTFVYSALPASVVLEANKTYYLVSSETENGDTWYNLTQNVTVSGGLSAISTVWRFPVPTTTATGMAASALVWWGSRVRPAEAPAGNRSLLSF